MTRFGIQIEPQFGFTYQEVVSLAQDAERLGFTAMWLSDHLFWDEHSEQRNCLDPWALLPALAPVTTSLRLGTLVSCNSYRLPGVLAKTAASCDHISKGRVEFGIGAGWKEMEYTAYGIPFPSVGTRLAQLGEAVQVIRQLWTHERASFRGEYYHLDNAPFAPKPVQQSPKLWIGGAGKRKLLRIVAEHADGWNMLIGFPLPEIKQRVETLEQHCDVIGRDYATIDKSLFIFVCVVEDEKELTTRAADLKRDLGSGSLIYASQKAGTGGTPEEIADTLRAYQAIGFDYFNIMFPYRQDGEMLQRFAEGVMPLLG